MIAPWSGPFTGITFNHEDIVCVHSQSFNDERSLSSVHPVDINVVLCLVVHDFIHNDVSIAQAWVWGVPL